MNPRELQFRLTHHQTQRELIPDTRGYYVNDVDTVGESVGLSHIVVGHRGNTPVLACGGSDKVNWTMHPTPRTKEVCPKCLAVRGVV